jgi:hypothetical protein
MISSAKTILAPKHKPPRSIRNAINSAAATNTINADSGCTDFLLTKASAHRLENRQPWDKYQVMVANKSVLTSSEKGELRVDGMTFPAYVVPAIGTNLASLSELCNRGCTATLTAETIEIQRQGKTIWSGTKGTSDRLWNLDLDDLQQPALQSDTAGSKEKTLKRAKSKDGKLDSSGAKTNEKGETPDKIHQNDSANACAQRAERPYSARPPLEPGVGTEVTAEDRAGQQTSTAFQTIHHSSDAEYVRYIHAVFASCPLSTLMRALVLGYLNNLPKLNEKMLRANPDVCRATAMGYLDQTRQGQRSTKHRKKATARAMAAYQYDPMDMGEESDSGNVCFQVITREQFFNSSDATGRFPIPTASGWEYILVSTLNGYVHLELLKDRTASEYRRAYTAMYAFYELHGKLPTTQRLDNESSGQLRAFLVEAKTKIEFVAPGIHRQNPSERAIRHAKNTIIAMCVTADPNFPANMLFEAVVPQAEIIINQLRPWHPDRTINAWAGMHNEQYDHLAHPLAPFAMAAVIHEKPHQRGTWATHGLDGFYLGPALQHYRCWRMYITSTRATRISDTVAWLPDPYCMPGHSPLEVLTAATSDLASAIQHITTSDAALLRQAHNPVTEGNLTAAVQLLRDLYTKPTGDRPQPPTVPFTATPPGFATALPADEPPQPADDTVCPYCLEDFEGWAHDCPAGGRWGDNPNFPQPRRPPRNTLPQLDAAGMQQDTPHREVLTQPPVNQDAPLQRVPPVNQDAPPQRVPPVNQDAPLQRVGDATLRQTPPSRAPAPLQVYNWVNVLKQHVKGAPLKHFQHLGRLFTDEEGTYRITAIEKNGAMARGKGCQTLFYKYYNIGEHMTPPTNSNDYERTPCAELKRDRSNTWTTEAVAGTALMAAVLNLSNDGSPLTTKAAMTGEFKAEWQLEDDKEFRKLATETETIAPIYRDQIPADRRKDVTYYNPQVREKIKEGKHVRRVRGTAGGDKVNYPGATAARTASLEVVRALLNSTLADDAEWSTADITDYYLNTPLLRPEYMRMTRRQISPTIMQEYDLEKYFHGDIIHFQINKGMYGLPQAGLLAQNGLIAHLATSGYTQSTTYSNTQTMASRLS